MNPRKTALCIICVAVLVLVLAACNRTSEPSTAEPIESAPEPTTDAQPTSPPVDTPTSVPAAGGGYMTSLGDEDCLMSIPGELGEVTNVFQADVDNEPKINIDRVFRMFHQSETPSTILRCDMNSGGFFSTWWMQSMRDEEAAKRLFDGFMESTAVAVDEHDANVFSCAGASGELDASGSEYRISFSNRQLCDGVVFEGVSGLILIGNNVVGIDAKFHPEFFDLIDAHARGVIERKSAE